MGSIRVILILSLLISSSMVICKMYRNYTIYSRKAEAEQYTCLMPEMLWATCWRASARTVQQDLVQRKVKKRLNCFSLRHFSLSFIHLYIQRRHCLYSIGITWGLRLPSPTLQWRLERPCLEFKRFFTTFLSVTMP